MADLGGRGAQFNRGKCLWPDGAHHRLHLLPLGSGERHRHSGDPFPEMTVLVVDEVAQSPRRRWQVLAASAAASCLNDPEKTAAAFVKPTLVAKFFLPNGRPGCAIAEDQ